MNTRENSVWLSDKWGLQEYSEIPLLRPSNINTSYLLETLFAKFKLFFFFIIFYTQCASD